MFLQHPFRQVYVEIPPSPLHTRTHHASTSVLKENTPLNPSHAGMLDSTSIKRKLVESETTSMPTAKKSKALSQDSSKARKSSDTVHAPCEEFPNGSFYCHQCYKKRDLSASIRCTFKDTSNRATSTIRCHNKFCEQCLKNRYGEDINVIKSKTGHEPGHVEDETYIFKCPKCRDICNCPRCRKLKGLEPTGALALGRKTKESVPRKVLSADGSSSVAQRSQSKTARKTKSLVVPTVCWTGMKLPLSLEEACVRIEIREFILRFAPIMTSNVAKMHLEELANIAGRRGDLDDDDLTSWVSDQCVKSVIIGILSLLIQEDNEDGNKILKGVIRDIRSSGVNLTKIWSILSSAREKLQQENDSVSFPDPLPPPSSSTLRNTRSLRGTLHLTIVTSAQMVPVVSGLIRSALSSDALRAEFEDGLRDGKDVWRDSREAIKKENEMYETETAKLNGTDSTELLQLKTARRAHKLKLLEVENMYKIALASFIPRLTPLGVDNEGRVYWALTPGIHERDYALDCIEDHVSDKSKKSKNKKWNVPDEERRRSLLDWSLFIAVWGSRPSDGKAVYFDSDVDSDDEEKDAEQWWAFWEPKEIENLARWIEITNSLDQEEPEALCTAQKHFMEGDSSIMDTRPPVREELKTLVRNLKDYATLLQWRTHRDVGKMVT